jgi:phospholipase C
MSGSPRFSRRTFLRDGCSLVAAAAAADAWQPAAALGRARLPSLPAPLQARATQAAALRALGRSTLRTRGSRPDPSLAAGTDTMAQIEHVVVLMMENHSYDNFFGMLGRGFGQRPRGDGFTLAIDGLPDANNPLADGKLQRAFRMPRTCQFGGVPSQEWAASHNAYDNGRMDGFVRTPVSAGSSQVVGPVAMGYWTAEDLPFTYALAGCFPIGDRWFSSLLGQTDPNRRFLIAGTSSGMTDDIGGDPVGDAGLGVPAAAGTIFNTFTENGISWADYAANSTTGATLNLYPANDGGYQKTNVRTDAQFFADARAGALPQFSLIDPDFGTQSQENPQNIAVGEAFLAEVVRAIGEGPGWLRTILIVTYDEHGGYYDHVPPPPALPPDDIPPQVLPGESTYDGFARYGFRVPSIVVSPYAKRNYVSHVLYDHTSVLAFVERKWNLPALTQRDANANDLTDFLDLAAMKAGRPTFSELPPLPAAGDTPARLACSKSGPGTVPVPLPPARLLIRSAMPAAGGRRLVVELQTDPGTLTGVELELLRGSRVLSRGKANGLQALSARRVVLPVGPGVLRGRLTLRARLGRRVLVERVLRLPH